MTFTGLRAGRSWEHTVKRVEGCVCGGVIRADPTDERSLRLAQENHNKTERHAEYHERWLAAGWGTA